MSKQPYIPLYIGDWEQDTNCLSPLAEFALLKLTFKLFRAEKKGVFEANFRTLSILFKSDLDTTKEILKELLHNKVLEISEIEDGGFIIKSRRMLRETDISEKRSAVGKIGGKAKRKQNIKQTESKSEAKPKQITDIDIENDIENKTNKLFIISGEFQKILDRWFDHKKARGEKYKSEDSKHTAAKKLFKLSNGDSVEAEKIIEEAIGNNWAGFFELKEKPVSQKRGFVA